VVFCGTPANDRKRCRTTILCAALSALEGALVWAYYPRHRSDEFRTLL
jgi:hypothetical protein